MTTAYLKMQGHEVKHTSNLLTQFGATSPTSRGYQAKNEITIVISIRSIHKSFHQPTNFSLNHYLCNFYLRLSLVLNMRDPPPTSS